MLNVNASSLQHCCDLGRHFSVDLSLIYTTGTDIDAGPAGCQNRTFHREPAQNWPYLTLGEDMC